MTYLHVLEIFRGRTWNLALTLFLGGLYSGEAYIQKKFVLVIRGLYAGRLIFEILRYIAIWIFRPQYFPVIKFHEKWLLKSAILSYKININMPLSHKPSQKVEDRFHDIIYYNLEIFDQFRRKMAQNTKFSKCHTCRLILWGDVKI